MRPDEPSDPTRTDAEPDDAPAPRGSGPGSSVEGHPVADEIDLSDTGRWGPSSQVEVTSDDRDDEIDLTDSGRWGRGQSAAAPAGEEPTSRWGNRKKRRTRGRRR